MSETLNLPVVPMKNAVLLPGVSFPITAGRPATLRAIESAMNDKDRRVFAVAQRQVTEGEAVTPDSLYTIGTIATVGSIQRGLGSVLLLLEGKSRGIATRFVTKDGMLEASVQEAKEMLALDPRDPAFIGLHHEVRERAAELGRKLGLPEEAISQFLEGVQEPGKLADLVAGYLDIQPAEKQALLETLAVEDRLRRVLLHVQRQIDVLSAQEDIQSKVKEELGGRQREMYLREQMKAIQKELGEGEGAEDESVKELRAKLDALDLPEDVLKEVNREWSRLTRIGRESMESQVIRTYLETIAELPWNSRGKDHLDVQEASRILDEDHYALSDVKDRILEFLAVRQLWQTRENAQKKEPGAKASEEPEAPAPGGEPAKTAGGEGTPDSIKEARESAHAKGKILLFAGPPGVGKTSIARSIARAMGRKYVRISLGGARDEADIRGHRRTYIGAMPGRILQTMRRAETINPLFMLDEIDKVGNDFRGDPSAALLEALDPEQNNAFSDHYLEVPYDLSKVLFVTTANTLDPIPPALRDRMEVIDFSGYIEEEKVAIAQQFLIPKQLMEHGLTPDQLRIGETTIRSIIREFTFEAGVRNLDRELANLARKTARKVAEGRRHSHTITPKTLDKFLGPPKYSFGLAEAKDEIGVATGVAWTEAGGDILPIEVTLLNGKGGLMLTGQLGEVMQESIQAALSYTRSRAKQFKIERTNFEKIDIHVHVPEGGIPKDGPSAGITVAIALISAFTQRAVRREVGMTGEITLRGRVLPIGGLKEKVMAAHRAGLKTMIIPKKNQKDMVEIPKKVLSDLNFILVDHMDEVVKEALQPESKRPAARNNPKGALRRRQGARKK